MRLLLFLYPLLAHWPLRGQIDLRAFKLLQQRSGRELEDWGIRGLGDLGDWGIGGLGDWGLATAQ